jgi:hypothetical protein
MIYVVTHGQANDSDNGNAIEGSAWGVIALGLITHD